MIPEGNLTSQAGEIMQRTRTARDKSQENTAPPPFWEISPKATLVMSLNSLLTPDPQGLVVDEVCIYIYIYIHIHTMHACMHACIHTYIHTYVCIYVCVCVYIYIYIYIPSPPLKQVRAHQGHGLLWDIYMYVCIHIYIYIYIHVYINIYISIYIYIYIMYIFD